MNSNISTQLKALKRITPAASFAARSRAAFLVMETPRVSPWHAFQRVGALGLALVVLFLVATFSIPARPTLSASLNEGVLEGELQNLPINIELNELTYRAATEQTLASAIAEVGNTELAHLNKDVLTSELSSLEEDAGRNEIDELLEDMLE